MTRPQMYLGYDPTALALLAAELRRGTHDLADHPALLRGPTAARALLTRSLSVATQWERITTAIVSCPPWDAEAHDNIGDVLAQALALEWSNMGWGVRRDPSEGRLDAASVDATAAAAGRALADRWERDGSDGISVGMDEISWLSGLLRTNASAAAAFVQGLGRAFVPVFDALNSRADRAEQRQVARIDSAAVVEPGRVSARHRPDPEPHADLLAALGATLGRWAPPGQLHTVLNRLDVGTASRLVDGGGLRGNDLARAALDILVRWSATDWWVEGSVTVRNPADRVVSTLAADPVAASLVASHLASAASPRGGAVDEVILFGPNDHRAPRDFWVAATDHRVHPPSMVGPVVIHLLDLLRSQPLTATPTMTRATMDHAHRPVTAPAVEQRWYQVRGWIGSVVAPWQIYLTGWSDLWCRSIDDGFAALRFVADHPRSAAALADGIGPALATALAALPSETIEQVWMVEQIGWSIGAADAILRRAADDEAGRARWIWSFLSLGAHRAARSVTAVATAGAPTPIPFVVGRAVGRATEAALGWLASTTGPLPDIDLEGLDRLQVASGTFVMLLFEAMVRDGLIPDDTPPPPPPSTRPPDDPYARDPLTVWVHTTALPPHAQAVLVAATNSVANAAQRGAQAAR